MVARTSSTASEDQLVEPETLLSVLPQAVLVVGANNDIRQANGRLDNIFQMGPRSLTGKNLEKVLGERSPIFPLLDRARAGNRAFAEHEVELSAALHHRVSVDAYAVPIEEGGEDMLLTLQARFMPTFMDRQSEIKGAALSVAGLAAMLAHEIKNPLSGIRGAAQLLGRRADAKGGELTELICSEVDRIRGLVDELEAFTDERPTELEPLNIHEAIDHAKRVSAAGFAKRVQFEERYDPSLPLALGQHDRLVQIFLNLIKNASEALGKVGEPVIRLSSAYRHSMWINMADGGSTALTT